METIVVGVISEIAPSSQVAPAWVRSAIATFFRSVETARQGAYPNAEIIVVSGAHYHLVSSLVYEEAAKRGWKHRVGKGWGEPRSAFYEECDVLGKMGDMPDSWCDEQENMFRQHKPGHMVVVFYH